MTFPEMNRERRGYAFYPTEAEIESIPGLYATEDIPLDEKQVYARYFVSGGRGEWFVMEVEKGDDGDTRMLVFGWGEITDGELGYSDLITLESLLIEHPDAPPTLVERDLSWVPRPWSQVRAERAALRHTIILTDRAVATDEGLFDPSSIARFIVENARGDHTRVYLVVDTMDERTIPLREFARANNITIWRVSTTRREGIWSDEIERVLAREEGTATVCDPWFKTSDPRVTVKRRVTR